MLTLLSEIFITERHRLRAGQVGYSMPLASEVDVQDRSIEPLLITTTRGTFLQSRVSSAGYARYGFSECSVKQEGTLLQEFHRVLLDRTNVNGWRSAASTVGEALRVMSDHGVKPYHLVGGPWLGGGPGDVRVLDGGFSDGLALLVAEPSAAGLHTRVGDYVGVLAYRVDRCFVAVAP
jgi:hypothetical protein